MTSAPLWATLAAPLRTLRALGTTLRLQGVYIAILIDFHGKWTSQMAVGSKGPDPLGRR